MAKKIRFSDFKKAMNEASYKTPIFITKTIIMTFD